MHIVLANEAIDAEYIQQCCITDYGLPLNHQ